MEKLVRQLVLLDIHQQKQSVIKVKSYGVYAKSLKKIIQEVLILVEKTLQMFLKEMVKK